MVVELIKVKMLPYIKEKKLILNISLDICILLSDVATVDHLQHIRHVCCFPAWYTYALVSEWSLYTFINMLASNNAIDIINTDSDTCYSTVDR